MHLLSRHAKDFRLLSYCLASACYLLLIPFAVLEIWFHFFPPSRTVHPDIIKFFLLSN